MLRHCAKCRMTTAHDGDGCIRCRTLAAFKKGKAKKRMRPETKRFLKDLNDWRRGRRKTDPRLER